MRRAVCITLSNATCGAPATVPVPQTPVRLMSFIAKTYVLFLHISFILMSDRDHRSRMFFDNEV